VEFDSDAQLSDGGLVAVYFRVPHDTPARDVAGIGIGGARRRGATVVIHQQHPTALHHHVDQTYQHALICINQVSAL